MLEWREFLQTLWASLKGQFLFRPGFPYLNSGTAGSCPRPVVRA